jgi:hypothetical protein
MGKLAKKAFKKLSYRESRNVAVPSYIFKSSETRTLFFWSSED